MRTAALLLAEAVAGLRRCGVSAIVGRLATPSPLAAAFVRNGLIPLPERLLAYRPIYIKGDDATPPGALHHTGADYDMC